MEEQKWNSLVDRLDDIHLEKSLMEKENPFSGDEETSTEWEYLQLAVRAVGHTGLHNQVAQVGEQFRADQASLKPVRQPRIRRVWWAAAAVLLIAGGLITYQFFSISSDGFYRRYYVSYELPVSRTATENAPLEEAYGSKSWQQVITLSEKDLRNDNKKDFLAGMANLELNRYKEAITLFEKVVANNAQSANPYFLDEAEYYLALSLLADKQAAKGIQLLKKIQAEPAHAFHERVEGMSEIALKILEYRSE